MWSNPMVCFKRIGLVGHGCLTVKNYWDCQIVETLIHDDPFRHKYTLLLSVSMGGALLRGASANPCIWIMAKGERLCSEQPFCEIQRGSSSHAVVIPRRIRLDGRALKNPNLRVIQLVTPHTGLLKP